MMIDTRDIVVILLAAGRSQRFGDEDKLLVSLLGRPVVEHVTETILAFGPARLIAVCNVADGPLARLLASKGYEIFINPHPELGMSRSVARGIEEASLGSHAAALICLADMPFITAAHLRAVADRFDPVEAPVVGSTDGDITSPPALFARSLFPTLANANGDRGGRAMLQSATLVTTTSGQLEDIDTPADIARPRPMSNVAKC